MKFPLYNPVLAGDQAMLRELFAVVDRLSQDPAARLLGMPGAQASRDRLRRPELREFLFDAIVHLSIFQLGRSMAGLAARVGQSLGLLRSVPNGAYAAT